jgi:hypothetical protein
MHEVAMSIATQVDKCFTKVIYIYKYILKLLYKFTADCYKTIRVVDFTMTPVI